MVHYYIYAKDFSGSTNGVHHYHKNGLKTLEQFKRHVDKIQQQEKTNGNPSESKIIYLHWGTKCFEVNEEETRTAYEELTCGWMGTEPEWIIKYIKDNYVVDDNNKIKLLYIITDGLIGYSSAKKCCESNEDMFYEIVVFHAFNEDQNCIDLSVAASFFKSQCMIYCNNSLYNSTDISKDYDYDSINVNNFAVEKEELKSYIRLKFINKYKQDAIALKEIDKLKKLRNTLFVELATGTKVKVDLETLDREVFLQEFLATDWYKNLTGSYVAKADIEKSISALINYIVSDAKSYSFDALKFETQYDKTVVEEEIDANFVAEQEIEFPDVILDDERGVPVILLNLQNLMEKIIFHGSQGSPASFGKFKSTMDCPLFLINDESISDSIGYFYTLNVFKQLLSSNTRNDPRTRKPFHGGLVLTDTDKFDKYNDFILSATYFNGKKVKYNVGLFYFVLWKNCERKQWMDKNVVEEFKKYTMRRISKTKCNIGLSSLPLDPQEKTSLLSALWYCVELSTSIFKNDPQNYKHERLRGFHSVASYMIEILQHFNYILDLEVIEKRCELIRNVMTLKRIPRDIDKVYHLLQKIFKSAHGFLISEIANPSNLYILNYLKLNHRDMLRDDVILEKVHLNDYVHLIYYEDVCAVEISEKTYRPFFAIDKTKSFYTQLVEITRKVVINNDDDKDKIEIGYEVLNSLEFDRILSYYKLYIDCVKETEEYPSLDAYTQYIAKRKMFKGDLVTIFPSNFYIDIEEVFKIYQKVVNKVGVKDFIQVCETNVGRTARIKTEDKVKFNDDKEIDEFISQQELKVNLIKKTQSQ